MQDGLKTRLGFDPHRISRCFRGFSCLLTFVSYLLWSHNEQWEFRGTQDALGHTAQHPTLGTTPSMGRQRNHITPMSCLYIFQILTSLRYAQQRTGYIHAYPDRRGDGELESGERAFMQSLLDSAEIGVRFQHPLLLRLCKAILLTILIHRGQA